MKEEILQAEEQEWQEYDARLLDEPPSRSSGAHPRFRNESLVTSEETFVAVKSPFLLSNPGGTDSETETRSGFSDEAERLEPRGTVFPGFESSLREPGKDAKFRNTSELDPYASIRSAMAPEHANLEAHEITLVLGRIPATVVLHQMVNSPEMRQATLAGLLGRAARRTVRLDGRDVSIPSYLRLLSRLCHEIAEQSEAEFEDRIPSGESASLLEVAGGGTQPLGASVGRNGVNHPQDVRLVQHLVNANLPVPLAPLLEDGVCGPKTIFAIGAYQQRTLGMNPPDGRVDPGGATFRALTGGGIAPPSSPKSKTVSGTFPPPVISASQSSHTTWGIPASVTLAQWAIESAWGRAMPTESNNPFGIKAVSGQPYVEARTREVVNGKDIFITARFRAFASLDEAFDQHGRLLATAKPYAHARTLVGDPDAFADALTGVYATDPHYGSVLKGLMKKYNLYQYD